ncbi:hypothetical protein TNCV_3490861 [Trichonephila clavipes]|nr:hypothetical protein TNCV_3490861 [Trichonephila clavipes]
MVWAGIYIDGLSDLHIIRNGNLVAQRYADEILPETSYHILESPMPGKWRIYPEDRTQYLPLHKHVTYY